MTHSILYPVACSYRELQCSLILGVAFGCFYKILHLLSSPSSLEGMILLAGPVPVTRVNTNACSGHTESALQKSAVVW